MRTAGQPTALAFSAATLMNLTVTSAAYSASTVSVICVTNVVLTGSVASETWIDTLHKRATCADVGAKLSGAGHRMEALPWCG